MKVTTDFDAQLLDNSQDFQGDFYKRFELRPDKAPLNLNDSVSKNYLFPTFYGDVTCAIAIFMCSYKKAQEILPYSDVKPVSMGNGRALVLLSCYEYKNVLGVPPYNEIAMTIPIMVKPKMNVPILPIITPFFKEFGYYCFSMPVTSLENQIRGEKIWGLPKIVQEIDINESESECHIQAKEDNGEVYFDLTVPTTGKLTHFDDAANLYTQKEGEWLQSQTCYQGDFKVTKHMDLLWKKGKQPDKEYLKLGTGPSAEILRKLEIESHPFQFRFAKHMASCFDLPNPNYQSPFKN